MTPDAKEMTIEKAREIVAELRVKVGDKKIDSRAAIFIYSDGFIKGYEAAQAATSSRDSQIERLVSAVERIRKRHGGNWHGTEDQDILEEALKPFMREGDSK